MTLMPVSKASIFTFWSTRVGGGWWMGSRFTAFTGPRSSTGSPMTLRIRPSTSLPTGTEMGAPRFFTCIPRVRPSVESMATQRAVFSPRCAATSMTRLSWRASMPGLVSERAV